MVRPPRLASAALLATLALATTGVGIAGVATSGLQPPSRVNSAEEVAQAIEERETGRDARLEMTMRLFDRQNRQRERVLVLTTLSAPPGAATGDRLLIRFVAPNDIKGTGFLVWEHAQADDERFLYLPALGRVRRIAGAEKQESFVGSDLSYEDIGGRQLDDYRYAFVQRDATWTAPDGRAYPAWQLESRAQDPQATYPRSISLVRKDNFVVVSAEIFNRRNQREKKYEVRRLEPISGIWTAMDVAMVNELQRTRTELVVTAARYNLGLSADDFTRRALEQGAR